MGGRQPAWVDAAVDSYAGRLPRDWRFRIDTIPVAKRAENAPSDRAVAAEADQLLDRIDRDERLLLLDERGRSFDSRKLAARLADWQADGRDLVFVIGGPDGVAESVRAAAEFTWSLSDLTLPHGLARVLLTEQLYRAWTLTTGHPYHRQ